jgi:hypothetical protein
VDTLLKLFDTLTEKIPLSILHYIRLGALFLWMIGAILAVAFSWTKGGESAGQSGQDLYLSEIKERAVQEEKRREPPDVVIPDLETTERKGGFVEREPLLPDEADRPVRTELPPFLNERERGELPNTFLPSYKPERETLGDTREEIPFLNKNGEPGGKGTRRGDEKGERPSERVEFLPLE